jgi:hypothetical protein
MHLIFSDGERTPIQAGHSGGSPAVAVHGQPAPSLAARAVSRASMAATLARRIRSRNRAVTVRWQRRQSVRILSRSHSPPPSVTGRMWSASQRLLRIRLLSPQCRIRATRLSPRARFNLRCSLIVSRPQWAHTPSSRFKICSRRYPGCDRSFHSCTQKSEQKVKRRGGTSSEHHRHKPRPFGPRGTFLRLTHPPPGMIREVLIRLF